MISITTTLLFSVSILAITVLWKKCWLYIRRVRVLLKMPGPKYYPFIGTANYFQDVKYENMLFAEMALMKKYNYSPNCIWTGLNGIVFISKAQHIEKILTNPKHNHKSHIYAFITSWLGGGLITANGSQWQIYRKLLTPTFHFSILEQFLNSFCQNSKSLVSLLEERIKTETEIDLHPLITSCTLDILMETAMGWKKESNNYTKEDYIKALHNFGVLLVLRTLKPFHYFDFIYQLSNNGKKSHKLVKNLHAFTEKVIAEKRSNSQNVIDTPDDLGRKAKLSFLDLLLKIKLNDKPLSDLSIREQTDTFMFAGHDTITSAISWILLCLGTYLDIQQKVFEELDGIFQGDHSATITKDHLNQMEYLERVIKESMRLFAPVRRISRILGEDTQFDDYLVPEGTEVSMHIFTLHRNPEYFENPDKFDPDRFTVENASKRHPFAYIPFSAGTRNCIGKKFAMLEMKIVVSTIIRNFSIRAVEDLIKIKPFIQFVIMPTSGVKLILEKR